MHTLYQGIEIDAVVVNGVYLRCFRRSMMCILIQRDALSQTDGNSIPSLLLVEFLRFSDL